MTWQTDLYDSMLEDIYTLTNRPDLEGETRIALRSATVNAHLTDIYFRDRITNQVQLPNASNQVAFDIPTLFPGFRGLVDVRPIDMNFNLIAVGNGLNGNDPLIEVVEMGDIYDPQYGNVRTNIAYASGDKIVVRSPISCWGYAFEYARAPQTTRELYNSWIAQMAPAIIQFWAAAIVFNTNGNEEKARSYLNQVDKFYIPQLKQSFLLSAQR